MINVAAPLTAPAEIKVEDVLPDGKGQLWLIYSLNGDGMFAPIDPGALLISTSILLDRMHDGRLIPMYLDEEGHVQFLLNGEDESEVEPNLFDEKPNGIIESSIAYPLTAALVTIAIVGVPVSKLFRSIKKASA